VLRPALPAALIAAALLPAAASAATLTSTASPSQTDYVAGLGDDIGLNITGDASNAYFHPTGDPQLHPTGNGTCTVVTMGNGASTCPRRTRIKIQLAGQDDFVGVNSPADVVEIHFGGGDDDMWSLGTRVEAYGDAGADELQGGPGIDQLNGGEGGDTLTPSSFADVLAGGPGSDTANYAGQVETVVVTLDDVANDGRRATGAHVADNQNVKSDVENVVGGTVGDELDGNAKANGIRGGDGPDQINGGAGADTLSGDAGDDMVVAEDGVADTVNCGPGTDSVVADVADVLSNCENVTLPDDDGDGVRQPLDCNDANPAIKPGASEIAGDGIDQDCGGADLPKTGGVDPDPTDPAPVDPKPADPERVEARLLARWGLGKRATVIFQFDVKDIPAGGKVSMRCEGKGCPFERKTVRPKGSTAKLGKHFAGAKLKPGTTLEVRVTAPGMVGKVVRYTFRAKRKLPSSTRRCLAPGASKPSRC